MKRLKYQSEPLEIFPAFTDLMSNAFMILSLFLVLALVESQRLNYQIQNTNKQLQEAVQKLQSAAPILIDEQSGQFTFTPNSAELSPQLRQYISTKIIPAIEENTQKHDIDFVQVIGHTDGQGINSSGNLDSQLENVAVGTQTVKQLTPGSNADLGLMRALAVVQEIEKTGRLKTVKFRAYSAAQLYLPSGDLAKVNRQDNPNRRRIEIRFIPPGEKQ